MSPAVIRLQAARRYYGSRLAFSVDDLEIFANECVGIAGKNGAGKSTLLRVLAGITRLSSGQMDVTPAWSKAAIAYSPQGGGLYTDLTVSDNVRCMIRRFASRSTHGLFEELWRNSELTELANVEVGKLSGGFQKLAMIATTLAVGAGVIILDEPTSDLHPTHEKMIAGIISQASQHYLAVIFSDHSSEMLKTATRVVEVVKA